MMTKHFSLWQFFTMLLVFWGISLLIPAKSEMLFMLNFIGAGCLLILFNPVKLSFNRCFVLSICFFLCILFLFFIPPKAYAIWLFLLLVVLDYFLNRPSITIREGTLLIVSVAGFFNLSFVSATAFNDVQYDIASCYNYIEYILDNHFLFWHENPLLTRPSYSSYHPILHFFIAALGIYGGEWLHFSREAATEAVQVFFVCYMFWYGLICSKILSFFKFEKTTHLTLLAFIVCFPLYRAISGFFNNDCLLLPLQAATVYYSLLYWRDGGRKNLMLIFVYATLASLTKLSGILVLPVTALALLLRLINTKDKKTLYDEIVFGVCLLLGLSIWPIYQHLMLHVGFSYVPPQTHLTLENYSLWERFSPLGAFVYDKMFYNDFGINLWETMTKTALFGQWDFSYRGQDIMLFIKALILSYKFIIATVILAFVYLFFKTDEKPLYWFTTVLILSLLAGQIAFGLKHPYMCNQDFRYVALLPLGFALILGQFSAKLKPIVKNVLLVFVDIFSLLSLFVWQFVLL